MALHGPAHDANPLCPMFAAAMEILARPWTGLVIAALEGGPLRFGELGERVGAIGDRMLSVRLRDLEERGLVERKVLCGPPVRVEYALTDAGRGFREVAEAVSRWGAMIEKARSAVAQPLAAARGSRDHGTRPPRRAARRPA